MVKTDLLSNIDIAPEFDKRYKTVLSFPTTTKNVEKFTWVDNHTSGRSVDVAFKNNMVYMAFEDANDALIFKIKFL